MNLKLVIIVSLSVCTVLFVGAYLTGRGISRVPGVRIKPACPVCPKVSSSPTCPDCPKVSAATACPVCPKVSPPAPFSSEKQEIADTLVDIHRQFSALSSHNKPATPQLLLKLEGIIERLDVKYKISAGLSPQQPKNDKKKVVCPEEYHGSKYGHPFHEKGWDITHCTDAKKMPEVVTILLNTMLYPKDMDVHIARVLRGIDKLYAGVQILIATTNTKTISTAKEFRNVKIVRVGEKSTYGNSWNQLLKLSETPYTVIARDLVHFDFNAQLERQIRVASELDHVAVVGGAFRNLSGHWRIGCRQSRMKNYVLKFQEGYHYSTNSCMFCDDLQGPFVAKTEILKSLKFKEDGRSEVLFVDFFLRVKNAGYLVMNCPDAMYFTLTDPVVIKTETSKEAWREFVTEWVLERIILSQNIMHIFSCNDIGHKCSSSTTSFAPHPNCCLQQFARAIKFLNDFVRSTKITYEFDSGSVLGSMKFNSFTPYDLDGDIFLYNKNISVFQKHMQDFKSNDFHFSGLRLPVFDKNGNAKSTYGKFVLHTPDLYSDMTGIDILSGDVLLPVELRFQRYFTKVRFSGMWAVTKFNPGMYSRNCYGHEVLKHAQSAHKVDVEGLNPYKAGHFVKCSRPGFHSCLDTFSGDGNLALKQETYY